MITHSTAAGSRASVLSDTASVRALALALMIAAPAAAFAQDTPADAAAAADQAARDAAVAADDAARAAADAEQVDQDGEEIVVTGFRASLQNALVAKKARDQVVEAISAEDIGKLPDASIAESIARLPGLTSQRVSGRSNAISIRGFAPDFSTTLLNGREQTSTGDNRAVEYDQYPSEVVSQVLVYKTPMASLIGQGLSGTVDLRTIRPLEFGRQQLSIGGRGTYADLGKLNSDSEEFGYRVNATYVDQFADDTIGIAVSASYLDEPYQIQEFEAWGYGSPGVDDDRYGQLVNGVRVARPGYEQAIGAAVIGGSKSYVTSTQLTRLGLQGTLEWQVTPEFNTSFDAFYSDFEDRQIKRGIELPLFFSGATLQPNPTVENGFITAGTYTGVEGVVRNDAFIRKAKLYSFGWNGKYEGDDGWNVTADVSLSKTDRNELVLESNAGTGRGGGVGAVDTIAFQSGETGTVFDPTLNYGDYSLIQLTSPLGWGGDQTAVDGRRIRGGQDGYYNNRIIEDELWQYRLDIQKELEGNFLSSIQFGLNYTDRSKSLVPDEAFLGLVANTDGLTSVPVPQEFQLEPTDLTYLGLGQVISYDPVALLDAGIYQLVANPYGDVVVKRYSISEKLMTGYLQGNIRSEIGASELTGNFGAQVIFTDQNSLGAQAAFLGTNPNGSPNVAGIPRNESTDYVDVLPSLNLSLRLPSDFVIRVGLAREIIRPRIDDLKASSNYGVTIGDLGGITNPLPGRFYGTVRGSSGNPDLEPWRANAADLTFEKYFGNQGYIAAQLFYKDLKSYIYTQDVPFDFTGLPIQSPGLDVNGLPIIVNYQGTLNVPINGQGGSLYGVELAATLPFSTFSSALDGFGVTGGVSYTETEIEPSPGSTEQLPGYSKWVANGTAFFEKWGLNARGSVRYRSSFVGELSGFGAVRQRRLALDETIVDAQIGYDFQPGSALEGLSVFVQGQNLTDERFATTFPQDERGIINYQSYGRRFLAGASFKFGGN